MLTTCVLGAFIKNTALVATFLPVTLSVCARTRTSPARVLLPMSYAAQMGGVCTLLGTSSNLLTNSLAVQHGLPEFGVFDFTRLGAILAVVGIVYLMLIGRWLLPRHIETNRIGEPRTRPFRDRTAPHGRFAVDRIEHRRAQARREIRHLRARTVARRRTSVGSARTGTEGRRRAARARRLGTRRRIPAPVQAGNRAGARTQRRRAENQTA